ncbi:MAG: nucleotidyl transferase AbiEii/AbiGii toxin family protein [Proteobacteria bacterium]|nr:nucleotidyl transferase AbiEii/AbiGii toxin family protein [Pseudomonadota bacterium]
MIAAECFEKDWIFKQKQLLGNVDPGILEKAIYALALLGHLAESGLPFVFKGGTSLLLHLDPIRRLSIDIDIFCHAAPANLDAVLDRIATLAPFTGYEEQDRGQRGLPHRRHFKFFYDSPTQGGRLHILLDVVEEANCPVELVEKPILTPFIEVEREVRVQVPTIEGLLGDKLTAFAPHTTGVPLFRNDGTSGDTMQVVKQLFDVAELFGAIGDLAAVARAYDAVQALENGYRGSGFTREATLIDTRDAACTLASRDLRGVARNAEADLLWDGSRRLQSHLVGGRFNLDDARIAAGKVALLCSALLHNRLDLTPADLRYDGNAEALGPHQIEGEWQVLNRLKGANPEAFFYWHKAYLIEST